MQIIDEIETIGKYPCESKELVKYDRSKVFSHPLAMEFKNWLTRVPYMTAQKMAVQHVNQAYNVWHDMTVNYDMQGLLEKTALNAWFCRNLEEMKPGTVASYLGSLNRLI